jgi:23S rRNA U2552 (ribose-2'-O)-methylase RlmE/FtsJ
MESHVPWHTSSPWQNIRLYKRNAFSITDLVYKEPENTSVLGLQGKIENELQEKELHFYRDKINNYEKTLSSGKNWEYYKKIVNPYELIYTQKKYTNFPESICFLKPLSRSYFKMLEILDIVKFFDMFKTEQIKTAHICEGPGGFIEAVYDRAAMNRKQIHSSLAMTLRSKQSNIPGWKRATQFLQKYRNIKIIYGHDGTGDVMKPENQEQFIDLQKNKSHLFTSDGGFDFSVDYTKQEEMIFPLLISSTRIGLESLRRGGVFVMKIFDFYRKSTQDLLYLLSCHFSNWTLYKPATSRPCNPEHYFIGKDFLGISEQTLDFLRLWINEAESGKYHTQLFSDSFTYSEYFKNIITEIQNTSFKKQIEYLEKVFSIIESNDEKVIKKYLQYNELISYEWCKYFKVPIYSSRYHAIVELYNDQRDVYQQS